MIAMSYSLIIDDDIDAVSDWDGDSFGHFVQLSF